MNSGRETISFRYLVVGNGEILYRADDKREVERYIQGRASDDTAVFQRRYTVEASLFAIEYEDEPVSDNIYNTPEGAEYYINQERHKAYRNELRAEQRNKLKESKNE